MAFYDQLTTAELTTLKTNTLAAINSVLTAGQAMGADGRTLTQASLPELRATLKEITTALDRKANTGIRFKRIVPSGL